MLLTSLGKNSRERSNSQTLVEMRGVFNLKCGTEMNFQLKTTKTEANETLKFAKTSKEEQLERGGKEKKLGSNGRNNNAAFTVIV